MSKHIITKSKMIVDGYVDAAGIGRRLFILPGEILTQSTLRRKSAEVVVVAVTSRARREQHGGLTKQRRTEH
jgi:hypothetical protein